MIGNNMRALIQRVTKASVQIDNRVVGKIDQGLLILVCTMAGDAETEVEKLANLEQICRLA
jgi:D-tyrosyl-tRNA(Tyr) deacylase